MDIEALIRQTQFIMRSRYAEMVLQKMGDSDPEAKREDLYTQLKAFCPALQREDMSALYGALELRGALTLLTNDTATFSKEFAR